MQDRPVICFITGSSGDWGGASRVIYTSLRLMDRTRLEPLLLLPDEGPVIQELQERSLRYQIWGRLTEPGNVGAYLGAFWRALMFFKRERVEVIHVNNSNFWRPAELLAAWLLRIPIVAHYHVLNLEPSPFISLCRAAISVSRFTAEHSHPATLDRPVIYNPIALERFDAGRSLRNELGIDANEIVISFLGQIREIKGVQDFIAMARRVSAPHARFLIAGECRDPQRFSGSYTPDDLKMLIAGDQRIRYMGYVEQVEDVYHTSDLIVMPSRWQEPLGLISQEAAACRKAVVATRVGGIPEALQDGVTGFLVDPGDIDALVKYVEKLIDDAPLRREMGDAGRRFVEREFTTRPVREFEDLLLSYCSA